MLKKRINEEYVNDALRALEDKLKRELGVITNGDSDRVENVRNDLSSRMKVLDDTFQEKLKAHKSTLKDLDTQYDKKFFTRERFEE